MKRFCHRVVTAAVLLSVVAMSTACYGPFNLTKNVYHWNSNIKGNGEINDKWMRELVFFGMIIIPAYEFSALLDMFIFNSMHFWTGESPIKASDFGSEATKVTTLGETTIQWTPSNDGAAVTYERHGALQRRATIVSRATGYRLVDENGNVLSEAEYNGDGSVQLRDGNGRMIDRWSKEELHSMAQHSAALIDQWANSSERLGSPLETLTFGSSARPVNAGVKKKLLRSSVISL